jgi:hypothetical protein
MPDEPGHGRGTDAARIPLEAVGNVLRRVDRADDGADVRGSKRADQQDPVQLGLILPAGGGQVRRGQRCPGRADAGGGQRLTLHEGPGGKEVLRGGPHPVAGEIGKPYPFLPGEPVARSQAYQERLRAEHLADETVAFIDEPAGERDVDGGVSDSLEEIGQPQLRPDEVDRRCRLGEGRAQMAGKHRRDRRGHAQ